ncbi:hypothetical protein HELRODRAFT_169013 [Helobdella robusta]|uniref:Uncharacterized protein n=1 Tax=Helobdella robusta TaxID=6412 RepID=T1F194_HELRO|nr:hypothetical protein HELRODRAFT_169013 [Helobdella robusta]ESO09074.1 hypothetical protein HELRODRAFT_169013 [Helobdella robusta]
MAHSVKVPLASTDVSKQDSDIFGIRALAHKIEMGTFMKDSSKIDPREYFKTIRKEFDQNGKEEDLDDMDKLMLNSKKPRTRENFFEKFLRISPNEETVETATQKSEIILPAYSPADDVEWDARVNCDTRANYVAHVDEDDDENDNEGQEFGTDNVSSFELTLPTCNRKKSFVLINLDDDVNDGFIANEDEICIAASLIDNKGVCPKYEVSKEVSSRGYNRRKSEVINGIYVVYVLVYFFYYCWYSKKRSTKFALKQLCSSVGNLEPKDKRTFDYLWKLQHCLCLKQLKKIHLSEILNLRNNKHLMIVGSYGCNKRIPDLGRSI